MEEVWTLSMRIVTMIWILGPLWSIGVLIVRVAVELTVPQAGCWRWMESIELELEPRLAFCG